MELLSKLDRGVGVTWKKREGERRAQKSYDFASFHDLDSGPGNRDATNLRFGSDAVNMTRAARVAIARCRGAAEYCRQ